MKQGVFKYIRLLLPIVAFFSIFSCGGDKTTVREQRPQSKSTIQRARITFTEGGKLQAILYASRLETRGELTFGWDIDVKFFTDDDTIPDGGMIADSGYVTEGTGRNRLVKVFGNISLIAPDGTKLYADSLRWNPTTGKIESNSRVKVVRRTEMVEGIGIVSDPNFKEIRVKNVRGRLES